MTLHTVPTIKRLPNSKDYKMAEESGFIQPYWMLPDNVAATPLGCVTFGAGALVGDTLTAVYTVSQDGAFDWEFMGFTALVHTDFDIDITYNGGSGTRKLTSRPLRALNIAGVGLRPFRLPEPLYLRANESITIQFTAQTAGANVIYLWLSGTRYLTRTGAPSGLIKWLKLREDRAQLTQPYLVSTVVDIAAPAVALSVGNSFFQVESDAFFEVRKLTGLELTLPAAIATWLWDVTDADSGRRLMNNQMYSTVFGDAQYPHPLDHSWVINPSRKIVVNITNVVGAGIINVQAVFCGRRIFVR